MRTHVFAVPAFLLAAGLCALSTDSSAAIAARTFVLGNYTIELDGKPAGTASSLAGGGVSAAVVMERSGAAGSYPKKRVGQPSFDDIILTVGTPDRPLADWIKGSIGSAQPVRKDGAIIVADYNYKEVSRTSWARGYLSEITFPELNAADGKKLWQMELTITPDSSSYTTAGAGKAVTAVASKTAARVTSNNFKLTIPGLNLTRVNQIEDISVRFRPLVPAAGEQRFPTSSGGTVDVSNLAFTLPEADGPQLYAWYQSFVGKGGSDKKTATIEMLGLDTKTLIKLTLSGVGIIKVTPSGGAAGESVRRVRAEAFVESMAVDLP